VRLGEVDGEGDGDEGFSSETRKKVVLQGEDG
jgi:hypothetical protein